MPNHLINSTSTYLQQHAHQPVNWYPWCEEALRIAQQKQKPIFLSIGYSACHWCHVMARESFEDPRVAAILNEYFVPIKVDREERPELDRIYMSALVAMTGQGGWPVSLFLTPDGKPFYGGTYFPPQPRYGLPSFTQVLQYVIDLWTHDRERVLQAGEAVTAALKTVLQPAPQGELPVQARLALTDAVEALAREYDPIYGGWGGGPKFPLPAVIEFLLRQTLRGDKRAEEMVLHTLKSMAIGGIYDLLGGGFHRYSVDAQWKVPHFEKMLYDNAMLVRMYLYAWLVHGLPLFREVTVHTIEFLLRELAAPSGGFYSSLSAETNGVEGASYTWDREEVERLLPESGRAILLHALGLDGPPQLPDGRYVLRLAAGPDELAVRLRMEPEELGSLLKSAACRLFRARMLRQQPEPDRKIILGWNALLVWALAEAGFYLNRPDWIEIARRTADFLLTHFSSQDQWSHVWFEARRSSAPAQLEDHAALALALLTLYRTGDGPSRFNEALHQFEIIETRFSDRAGGWFDTSVDQPVPLLRPKPLEDQPYPCGQSLTATLCLQLWQYTGESSYWNRAEQALASTSRLIHRYPAAFGQWLTVLDLLLGPTQEIVLIGPRHAPLLNQFQEILRQQWRARSVWAIVSSEEELKRGPQLVRMHRRMLDTTQAVVCQGGRCLEPAKGLDEFRSRLMPDG